MLSKSFKLSVERYVNVLFPPKKSSFPFYVIICCIAVIRMYSLCTNYECHIIHRESLDFTHCFILLYNEEEYCLAM